MLRPKNRTIVRPWALLTPVVVLLIALPLLRPLRHPEPSNLSDIESATQATVQSVVEHRTLAIEATNFTDTHEKIERGGHFYSTEPPTFPVLLSGSYWVMHRFGARFDNRPDLVAYFLTLLGSTLPVALAASLVYRMGRVFELKRPWRAALALASVLATGFISYATVLNPHAPAAALVLCSAACLIHLTITNRRLHSSVWLVLGGFCAALGATIDPPALIFLVMFLPVILAFRWPVHHRLGGAFAFMIGAAGPIALHVMLMHASGGSAMEGLGWGLDRLPSSMSYSAQTPATTAFETELEEDELPSVPWQYTTSGLSRIVGALIGRHGIFTHFPIVLLGILGVTMVMHRHWPPVTKLLATATICGGSAILLAYAIGDTDWGDPMFATRFFVVFLPLTLFWAGAWLRRSHHPATWAVAGLLLCFSTVVSLIGATGPLPRAGFHDENGASIYTGTAALKNLTDPSSVETVAPTIAAGR